MYGAKGHDPGFCGICSPNEQPLAQLIDFGINSEVARKEFWRLPLRSVPRGKCRGREQLWFPPKILKQFEISAHCVFSKRIRGSQVAEQLHNVLNQELLAVEVRAQRR